MNEMIACPKCGAQFTFETFPILYTPEQILDLSAFKAVCPSCNAELILPYPCVYCDTEKRIIIRLIPHDFDISDLSEDVPAAEYDYSLREVHSVHSFREKTLIFEYGLDDRAIELLKILTIQQNPERFDVSDPDVLLLADADEETLSMFALAKDGNDFILKTPFGLYNQMCAELVNLKIDVPHGYESVNGDWILEQFRNAEH
ncbi:MAG: CpXC domain-containing protein [Christensenella sp.]